MTVSPALLPPQAAITRVLESTYGVTPTSGPATRTRIVPPLTPAGIDAMTAVQEVGHTLTTARDTNLIAPDLISPTLSLTAMASISEIGWLLASTFGDATSTAGSGGDSGHTVDAYVSGGSIRSHTLQAGIGNLVRVYRGWCVDQLTVDLGKTGGFRQIQASGVCRAATTSSVLSGLTVGDPPAPIYIPGWASALTIGGVAFPITAGSLTYANNLERPTQTDGLREPGTVDGGTATLELSLTAILRNQAQVAAFDGAVGSSAAIGIEMRPAAGSAPRLTFAIPTALIAKPDIAIVDGQQSVSLTVQARQTSSQPMLQATIVRPTV